MQPQEHFMKSGRNTDDIREWNKLAEIHLSRFNLPKWGVPCSVDQMERWLDRLNLDKHSYYKRTRTTLQEFIDLNPDWSLRAFIGTILEMKAEQAWEGLRKTIRVYKEMIMKISPTHLKSESKPTVLSVFCVGFFIWREAENGFGLATPLKVRLLPRNGNVLGSSPRLSGSPPFMGT